MAKKGMMKILGSNMIHSSPVVDVKEKKPVILPMVDNWLEQRLNEIYVDERPLWGSPRPVYKGWTPNSIGEPNDRLLVAALLGYRGDPISPRLQMIFDAGHDIEARWVKRFTKMGILVDNNVWLPKPSPAPLVFSGKVDARVTHAYEPSRSFVVEIKSISPNGFRELPNASRDPQENYDNLMGMSGVVGDRVKKYMSQVQVYLHCMSMNEGILLFDNKGTQEFTTYYLTINDDALNTIYARLTDMQTSYWEKGLLPVWNGGKSKSIMATYKPDEVVSIEEMKAQYEVI